MFNQVKWPRWLNKRLLPHFLFWLFYVLFFGSIYGKYGNDYRWYLLESLCMLPFVMLATYVTIYAILPFYLQRKKLLVTVVLIIILLFFVTLGERIFLRLLNSLPITAESLFGVTFLYLLLETNFMVFIAFAIKIVKKWFEQQNEKHEMEKRNLQTELNLLKSQLHPHFLFNTMNNLYALSLEKSAKTSEGIAKMSDLLRSVLYECNESEIPLEKEIRLIENFIDLEKLRYANRLQLEFTVKGDVGRFKIAPMLLYTFVENCFKHGSRNDPGNPFIRIHIDATGDDFLFQAENSISASVIQKRKNTEGGVGLINAKKRLEIIYGNQYRLAINEGEKRFAVRLTICKRDGETAHQ